MNNLRKLFGVISIIAIIACTMAACDFLGGGGTEPITPIAPTNPPITLTAIAVTTPPAKTQYNLGEELNTTGMVVTATYSDGSTKAVMGYDTSGYTKTVLGNQTVTVTYSGKTAVFTVNVIDPDRQTVATPTANPVAGVIQKGMEITLATTTEGAEIWYTTNNSVPAKNGAGSAKYATKITLNTTTTIKAIAVKEGCNDSEILTAAYIEPTSVPAAPTGVTATVASSTSITISWSSVTGATGYKVYRSASSSGAYSQVGTPTSASYTDTGLAANTTYYYKVAATNSAGESSQSSSVSATTTPSNNFNRADYVIVNETGKPDSAPEIAWLKEYTWFMYAVNESVGDWMANYIKTNKIKTVLAEGNYGWAWIYPDRLDRLYLNVGFFRSNDYNYDFNEVPQSGYFYQFVTHETMHLVQYKSNAFSLMKGMRPDICAAAEMLTEFLAWFYTENRFPGAYITADMENAVATQSKYMILSTDPWAYNDARAKDPSLPNGVMGIHLTPWFNNEASFYAQHAFTSPLVRESAMTAPLRQASKEDILQVARTLLACRDPKQVGVTDEALWTAFDALRNVATGESKYLNFSDYRLSRESFNNFQALIAEWDAKIGAK